MLQITTIVFQLQLVQIAQTSNKNEKPQQTEPGWQDRESKGVERVQMDVCEWLVGEQVDQYQQLIKICKIQSNISLTLFVPYSYPLSMNQIPNLKYKTTFCLNWSQGLYCEKGVGCYFAHGQQDLRTLQQNRIAIAQRNQVALSYTPLTNYKTIFCKFYAKGECKLGDACTFAHERREKKIKKNHTISYEQENNYQNYPYYPPLNPWIAHFASYYHFPQTSPTDHIHEERANQAMKMSTETVSEEQLSPPLEKHHKQSQEVDKFELGVSQEIQEQYRVEQNPI